MTLNVKGQEREGKKKCVGCRMCAGHFAGWMLNVKEIEC